MIKTKEIDKYIHNVLLKRYSEQLTEDDLNSIKKIVLAGVNFDNEKIEYDFSDLEQLKNLESCTLEFFEITDEIILKLNSLSNLKELNISHCKILCSHKLLCDLNKLIISYTEVNDLDMLALPGSIETLELIKVGNVDFSNLTKLENVKNLYIYNSEINNIKEVNKLINLVWLKLDGTKVDDENALLNLNKNIKVQRKDVYLLESSI